MTDLRAEEAARVMAMPCLVNHEQRGPSKAVHMSVFGHHGVQGIVPLCDRCLDDLKASGGEAFERGLGIDVVAEADSIAVAHPRPLGICGLADRWAYAEDMMLGKQEGAVVYLGADKAPGGEAGWYWLIAEYPDDGVCGPFGSEDDAWEDAVTRGECFEPLSKAELGALLGWVSRECERAIDERDECEVCGTPLTRQEVVDGWTVHPACHRGRVAGEFHAQGNPPPEVIRAVESAYRRIQRPDDSDCTDEFATHIADKLSIDVELARALVEEARRR